MIRRRHPPPMHTGMKRLDTATCRLTSNVSTRPSRPISTMTSLDDGCLHSVMATTSCETSCTQTAAREQYKRSRILTLCPEQCCHYLVGKTFHGKLISKLRSITCHMESRVTCHPTKVNVSIPARQVGTRLTYPKGMEG